MEACFFFLFCFFSPASMGFPWAVGLTIDTDRLWENVVVRGVDNREVWYVQHLPDVGGSTTGHQAPSSSHPSVRSSLYRRITNGGNSQTHPSSQPVVRMISMSTKRRGNLPKRLLSAPFRSVLSLTQRCGCFRPPLVLDVEYAGAMPNLKLSILFVVQAPPEP